MDKPTIGIRQADGSFYEIMGDAQAGRKRLVLSAARTDQHGVKIALYRSEDGTFEESNSLGTITLDDPEGLGYKDIEFRLDLDPEGQLEASAALPGQPARTLSVDLSPFRGPRTDADILGDAALASAELDTLDDQFALEPEPMTLDLPESEELADLPDEPERRSDADILGDEGLASAELDTLDDFSLPEMDEPDSAMQADSASEDTDEFTMPDMDEPEATAQEDSTPEDMDDFSMPEMDEPAAEAAADSFDLGDLDAGFGADSMEDEAEDKPAAPPSMDAEEGEEWEKISLDDMESMEFMDTGDEISAPSASAAPASRSRSEFDTDESSPLELSDLDSDLSDLPDLGDSPDFDSSSDLDSSSGTDDLDQDFLPPPELTETPDWDVEEPMVTKPGKAAKPAKAPRAAKAPRPPRGAAAAAAVARESEALAQGLDKTALFLSLATLSLLVLLILVLLFLNMVKAPQPAGVQPEVMNWKPVPMASAARMEAPVAVDLNSASAPAFEGSSVLEVPEGLKTARISLRLEPGETVIDAERRFGTPAKSQGNLLLW